jgi:hypothetical protein
MAVAAAAAAARLRVCASQADMPKFAAATDISSSSFDSSGMVQHGYGDHINMCFD